MFVYVGDHSGNISVLKTQHEINESIRDVLVAMKSSVFYWDQWTPELENSMIILI